MKIQKLEHCFTNKLQFFTPGPSSYTTIWLNKNEYRL